MTSPKRAVKLTRWALAQEILNKHSLSLADGLEMVGNNKCSLSLASGLELEATMSVL